MKMGGEERWGLGIGEGVCEIGKGIFGEFFGARGADNQQMLRVSPEVRHRPTPPFPVWGVCLLFSGVVGLLLSNLPQC